MAHAQVREEQVVSETPAERVEQVRRPVAPRETQPQWTPRQREDQPEQAQRPSSSEPEWRWVPDPSDVGLPDPPRGSGPWPIDPDKVRVFAWARLLGLW